jgi:hypothetical protein
VDGREKGKVDKVVRKARPEKSRVRVFISSFHSSVRRCRKDVRPGAGELR